MIQSDLYQEGMLDYKECNVKTSEKAKWVNRIVPLKNYLVFIYYEGGCYELFNINTEELILSGELPEKIRFFLEIYTKVLVFHDPIDMQIKILDLKVNQVNPNFAFRSSEKIDINSDEETREIFIDKKKTKYLISQDLEKYYSNNNVCHFKIRVLPLEYDPSTNFNLKPVVNYDYPNSIQQTEFYHWLVDEETLTVFGQDNNNYKSEILFIKPHLMDKSFYIVHTEHKCSYTIMNVTNWVKPYQVAIWVNCNDGVTGSSIFTIDLRDYYNGQYWLPEPKYTPLLASDEYFNESEIFMDIYGFNINSSLVIQLQLVGSDAKMRLINYYNINKPEIISEVIVNYFWIEPAVDHSQIVLFNDISYLFLFIL
ncbi:unnamed protein product [Paramecium octaurelia]|uniref:Uncharacterized protein n=1 Tax=Paramecium octaurelia TaxID=43137 RepID=A0A8S1UTB5_PAROT|nr:unnamed protein product [Paramecium octaurelia]